MSRQPSKVSVGKVILLRPGAGQVLPGPEGITLKATAEDTGGSIGIFEATSPPRFGPPRHIHHSNDELFYVLAGEFQFLVGDQIVDAPAGSFVFIPRGTVHALKVLGNQPGRVLSAFVPGGPERTFEDFGRLTACEDGSEPDMDQLQAIAAKYDSEFVGPPL